MSATLSKDLSLRQLFSFGFGSIIGVGWITVMGGWLTSAGPLGAALAFFSCSFIVLIIALCYGELAIEFPVTGAELTYVHETFGLIPSFVVGWLMALAYIGIVIFEFVSVGWVIEALFPALREQIIYTVAGTDISLGGLLSGVIGTALITWFNLSGAKSSGGFQQFITFSLIAISIGFALLAFANGDADNLRPHFGGEHGDNTSKWGGFFAVFVTVPFWFGGFNVIAQAMSEKSGSSPSSAIRIVMTVAIMSAALFYALVILAAGFAAPQETVLAADLPVKVAVDAATGSVWAGRLVLIAGLLGLLSTWNAFVFGGSRILFALGRTSIIFPQLGALDDRSRVPVRALLFVTALGVVGGLFGRAAILPIVDTGSIVFAIAYLSVCAALLKRRISQPKDRGANSSIILPVLGVISALSICVAAIYFSYINRSGVVPLEWIVLVGWLIIGVIGFRLAQSGAQALSAEERRRVLLSEANDD